MTNRIGGDNYIRDEKFNKIADEVMDQIWGQFMLTILNNPEKISYDEFIKQKIPYIPLSIRLICDRVGLDWRPLRPMVATWWG